MIAEKLKTVLAVGETVAVEFKRCANGVNADTYEIVCLFLNRFGGDISLGVEDNGEVCGVPQNTAPELVKEFYQNGEQSGGHQPDRVSGTGDYRIRGQADRAYPRPALRRSTAIKK